MTRIVTDQGFANDIWTDAVDVPSDATDADLERIIAEDPPRIRVAFPSFADGRGFTIARILRKAGYRGGLRAAGHVLADQYAMARRSGFDDIEIDDELAARQPQDQWLARADWREGDYQARLGRR